MKRYRVLLVPVLFAASLCSFAAPVVAADQSPDASQQFGRHPTDQEKPPDWITAFTGVIAAATVIQVIVYVFQTHYIRKSLAATNASATAAINSQRAWLMCEPAEIAPKLVATDYHRQGSVVFKHFFAYRIWNAGVSTATNVKVFARYRTIESISLLPPEPEYGPLENLPPGALIPTDKSDSPNAAWNLKWLDPSPVLSEDNIRDITGQKLFLYAYGIVTYANGVGGVGTTKFGLLYHFPISGDWRPKGFHPAGPPGYNTCT
jgi:hypothetical protein